MSQEADFGGGEAILVSKTQEEQLILMNTNEAKTR